MESAHVCKLKGLKECNIDTLVMSEYSTISDIKTFVGDHCIHPTSWARCSDCMLTCCKECLKDELCPTCQTDATEGTDYKRRVQYARHCKDCNKLCGPCSNILIRGRGQIRAHYWCRKCNKSFIHQDWEEPDAMKKILESESESELKETN